MTAAAAAGDDDGSGTDEAHLSSLMCGDDVPTKMKTETGVGEAGWYTTMTRRKRRMVAVVVAVVVVAVAVAVRD
jgi:hypothetical protein